MPLYTYRCSNEKCAKEFDLQKRVDDRDVPTPCPQCAFMSHHIMADSAPIFIIPYGRIAPMPQRT